MGELSVLNCTAGDIRIKFDRDNPVDVERAKRMIQDMLRRGYILAVEVDGKTIIAKEFDAEHGEYIVAEGALYPGDADKVETDPILKTESDSAAEPQKFPKRGRGKRGIPLKAAKATGVPPTAGG